MKRICSILFALVAFFCATSVNAVTINKTVGWFESGAVEWAWESGATYTVSISSDGGSTWTQLDKELVRKYNGYGRADAVGLKAGSYMFKVASSTGGDATSSFTATAADRSGFAHYNRTEGVGAYNNDGTLKANARILYVTAANAKTVTLDMTTSSKGTETRTGLQDIIQAYEKGAETRPLDVRIIGTIKAADMDEFGSSAEGLQVKGKSSSTAANLTIEGIGFDAAIHGFGILCRSISSVEFKNFAIMDCLDDDLSLDTDNKYVWIHNMDLFYGQKGSAADQVKGDGTVDIKGKSSFVTVSYCHFFDNGKCSLGGMKSETTDCWMTYHHNWFDHSDSRHPRIRTAFYHVVNNYFSGNSKYATGVTMGGSAFCEGNYYRNVKYPFLSSKQGTDAEGDGTFSGENGGVIKACNNLVMNPKQVLYYKDGQTDGKWDAVKVDSRDATVSATAFTGGTSYNNAATSEAIKAYPTVEDPSTVPATVRGDLGAGRMEHGDFKWSFLNSVQDVNYAVITELRTALDSYKSTLVAYGDGTAAKNAGATDFVDGGDGKNISQEENDKYVPEWGEGGDTPEEEDFEEEPYIANADGTDFYWVGDGNVETTKTYITDGKITLGDSKAVNATTGSVYTSKFAETYAGNDTYPAEHTGSLQLGQASAAGTYNGGTATFYCPKGVTTFKINALRTGSCYYIVEKSTDGTTFTKVAEVNKATAGILSKDFSTSVRNLESTDPMWVRITNGSTGGLNIFGVLINQLSAGSSTLQNSDLKAVTTEKALKIGETYTLAKGTDYTTSSTGAVSYSSSKSSVATVSSTGVITAIGEGTATITIAQVKDETYKAGSASITVTVTDPRAASTFALTSAAEVSIKEAATSQITTTGAAGTLVYASNKTSVATVSATGLITAVAAGTATITVTDPGTTAIKGGSATVTVTVTKDMSGKTVVTFSKPSSGKVPVSSDETLVSFGGTTTYKDASYEHDGTTYEKGVKFESATEVYLTPGSNADVTLIFDEASKRTYLDGNTITSDANGEYKFTATGGTKYTLKKQDSVNLYAVIFDFGTSTDPSITSDATASISCKDDGAPVTKEIAVSGANLTGTKLSAKLDPAVEGLSVALASEDIKDGAISTTATLTYKGTTAARGTTTLKFTDGYIGRDVTVSYACQSSQKVEQTEVTKAATWDFSKLGATEIKLTATDTEKGTTATTPAKSSDFFLLANYNVIKESALSEITPDATFDAQAMMWAGEYIVRDGAYTQVDSIKLKTTRSGSFTVTYANTGNRDDVESNYRYVKINDVVAATGSISTTMATVTLNNIPAGDIMIQGVTTDGTTYSHAMLRIAKIEFTPSDEPTVTLTADATTVTKGTKITLTATTKNFSGTPKITYKVVMSDTYMTESSLNEYTPVAAGTYKFTATATSGSVTATSNTVIVEVTEPEPEPTPESSEVFNAFGTTGATSIVASDASKVAKTTVKVNGKDVTCYNFAKSITVTDGVVDYCIKITPSTAKLAAKGSQTTDEETPAFKAGDIISIAGAIYSGQDGKHGAIKLLGANADSLFCTENLVDTKTNTTIEPTVVTYTLTKDEACLYLGRYGNTGTNITTLTVSRPDTPTAINEVLSDDSINKMQKFVKYMKDGKLIIIKNGAEYNAAGARMK